MKCNEEFFTAKLIGIVSVEEGLKSDISDCIRVRANMENRKLKNEDIVAIFNITGTTSYQVFFIEDHSSLDHIKSEFKKMKTLLNYDSENVLISYIDKMEKIKNKDDSNRD
ncbi:DUF749 family protein [Methanothermococcus sp. SCGC AD-155-C09]|nr:DUF749 family protein [Methanothermococcus sp. SCGC AD-155-C09]